MNENLAICPNEVVKIIGKKPSEITRRDIIEYIVEQDIEMLNLMYTGEDGRMKTLNFVINDLNYLETILSCGERVDGSSLFPSYVEAGNSDLYVVPRYSTVFMDPFAELPTICFLCSFFDKSGASFGGSPAETLRRASEAFTQVTGMTFEAMGELEYYVISDEEEFFPATDQRGYHESAPYAKYNEFRQRCMSYIAKTGGIVKYGHAEVGNFRLDGKIYEQNEIEFLPCPVESAADQLVLAKWVIKNLAYQEGFNVTFAPKITHGKAGSGLHIHMRLMKDGRNMMISGGTLSEEARKAIAGMMLLAPSITAFGNRNPTSYMRLVPHQEAPTNVCWGDRNRSVLVRVPLGWTAGVDMCRMVNQHEEASMVDTSLKQTVEMRSPDGSADIHLLLAGLCVACRHGFECADALDVAQRTYVDGNIHSEENKEKFASLSHLPANCDASAKCLEEQRGVYEQYGVFNSKAIDGMINKLKSFDDSDLATIMTDKAKVLELVERFFHV